MLEVGFEVFTFCYKSDNSYLESPLEIKKRTQMVDQNCKGVIKFNRLSGNIFKYLRSLNMH